MSSGTSVAKPVSTPIGSFSRSHREIWTTSGAVAGTGASSSMTASRATRIVLPSASVTVGSPTGASITPAAASTASTVGLSIGTFFGEPASMQGGMIETREGSRPSHTYAGREKTVAAAARASSSRNAQASRARSFATSIPTWQTQITCAPRATSWGVSPTVCGSCSTTTSPRCTRASTGPRSRSSAAS